MNNQHPITPPPELVDQWWDEVKQNAKYDEPIGPLVTTKAARWGADQELEACCQWLENQTLCGHRELIPSLRRLRRPKPPSLKEQALALLDKAEDPSWDINDFSILRQALEALPND